MRLLLPLVSLSLEKYPLPTHNSSFLIISNQLPSFPRFELLAKLVGSLVFTKIYGVIVYLGFPLVLFGLSSEVSQPHFGLSVRIKLTLPKLGDLESSGTLECLKLNSRGQNTSDWSVLGVIGKRLKCRCSKCPRIGHLDICSPSYGQNKGQESNW